MYHAFTEWHFWITLLMIAVVMGVLQGTCAYLVLAERKISAWAQDRLGPNRVGPWGLLQPIADGLKFLFKEDLIPGHVDKAFYLLAPAIAIATATLAFAVVPFGPTTPAPTLLDYRTDAQVAASQVPLSADERNKVMEKETAFRDPPRGPVWPTTETELAYVLAADRAAARAQGHSSYEDQVKAYDERVQFVIVPRADIGIVFVFAVGSLAVYAIVLGGWSSNNKYSLLGSLRSSAQLISYEVPLGMSVLGVLLITGSLELEKLIHYQYAHGWNVLFQPLAALLFVTSVFAECNRLPFDLPEAEQELVGGYHTEYSALKFGMFFLGEYTHMITTSFLVVALFFGGPMLPFVPASLPGAEGVWWPAVIQVVIFGGKMALFIIFYMLIRWTLPRFRFDQLMALAWKVMMPLALLSFVGVLVVKHYGLSPWWLTPWSIFVMVAAAGISLSLPRPPARNPNVPRRFDTTGAPPALSPAEHEEMERLFR